MRRYGGGSRGGLRSRRRCGTCRRLRRQVKTLAARQPVGFEVVAVERPYRVDAGAHRRHDQRGIGQVHRPVGILFDPVDGAHQFVAAERQQFEAALVDPAIQRQGGGYRRCQMRELGEHGPGRHQPAAIRGEEGLAVFVGMVALVCQGHQRAGVDQNCAHRPCFLRMAAATRALVPPVFGVLACLPVLLADRQPIKPASCASS